MASNPFTSKPAAKAAAPAKGKRVSASQAKRLAEMLKGKSAKPAAPAAPVLDDDGDED